MVQYCMIMYMHMYACHNFVPMHLRTIRFCNQGLHSHIYMLSQNKNIKYLKLKLSAFIFYVYVVPELVRSKVTILPSYNAQ